MLGKRKKSNQSPKTPKMLETESIMAALSSQAIIEFEPDGTIISANDTYLSLVQYSLDDIVGKNHKMFVDPKHTDPVEHKQMWTSLRSGKFYTDQVCRVTRTGEQVWLQASYCPVTNNLNEVTKVIKFCTDITDRCRKEIDLVGKYAGIMRSQAVIEFDMQGNILTANSNFLETVDYKLPDIVGKHHSIFVPAEDVAKPDYQIMWNELREGIFASKRCRRVTRGGDHIWLQATYNPILDFNGKPVKVVKFAVDVTKQQQAESNLKTLIEEVTEVMASLKDGDLTKFIKGTYSPDLMVVVNSINQTITQLGSLIHDLDSNAHTIKDAASALNKLYVESKRAVDESAEHTHKIAAASGEISHSVCKAVSSMEKMTSSVEQVSSNSSEAAGVAQKAVELADSAKINVNQLADSSNAIGAVIKVINSIADQTNLLALNATIEAARAGDAGKGFAVVANEVKELAKETAKATEEVGVKITAIQKDSKVAVKAINDIGSTIENISDTQTSIAKNVDSQSLMSEDISRVFHEVVTGSRGIEGAIGEATAVAGDNIKRADNSHATTNELIGMAEELVTVVSRFRVSKA